MKNYLHNLQRTERFYDRSLLTPARQRQERQSCKKQTIGKEEENWMTHIAPPSAYSSSDQTRLGSQGHQHQLVIVYPIRLVC